jgi:hypothetical protein
VRPVVFFFVVLVLFVAFSAIHSTLGRAYCSVSLGLSS